MNNLDDNVAKSMENRDEVVKIHETITDIRVNVSFIIAGRKIEYENISKIGVRENGVQVLIQNKEEANTLFDKIIEETNVLVSDSDSIEEKKHERRLKGVIECIQLYPGEKRFYDAILNDILCADQVEFYEFIQYWKMTELFPNLTSRRRIMVEK